MQIEQRCVLLVTKLHVENLVIIRIQIKHNMKYELPTIGEKL